MPGMDGKQTRNPLIQSQGFNLIYYGTSTILGVPEKAEQRIFSTLRAESVIYFTSLDKESSAEENDT